MDNKFLDIYSYICLKRSLKEKKGFQDQQLLNADQKYCSLFLWSILQYFLPALSYQMALKPLFCLFLSSRLRQVSL